MHALGRRGNALTLSNHCSHDCQLHAITRLALLVALAVDPGGSLDSHRGHCRRLRGHNSVTGNRNRVARAKAEYRDQVDYTGFHSMHQRPAGPKPKQGLPRKMDSGVSAFVLRQHAQSDASECHRIIISSLAANNDDPPRTQTWNLRPRRPTPYPLGQRALCTSPSGRGYSQSQSIVNFIVSKCGSAPAQPPNSPVRFAVDSKSPDAFVGLNWF